MKVGDVIKSLDAEAFYDPNVKKWKIGMIISINGENGVKVMWETGKITYASKNNIWKINDERLL
jgi:hypothetical protein